MSFRFRKEFMDYVVLFVALCSINKVSPKVFRDEEEVTDITLTLYSSALLQKNVVQALGEILQNPDAGKMLTWEQIAKLSWLQESLISRRLSTLSMVPTAQKLLLTSTVVPPEKQLSLIIHETCLNYWDDKILTHRFKISSVLKALPRALRTVNVFHLVSTARCTNAEVFLDVVFTRLKEGSVPLSSPLLYGIFYTYPFGCILPDFQEALDYVSKEIIYKANILNDLYVRISLKQNDLKTLLLDILQFLLSSQSPLSQKAKLGIQIMLPYLTTDTCMYMYSYGLSVNKNHDLLFSALKDSDYPADVRDVKHTLVAALEAKELDLKKYMVGFDPEIYGSNRLSLLLAYLQRLHISLPNTHPASAYVSTLLPYVKFKYVISKGGSYIPRTSLDIAVLLNAFNTIGELNEARDEIYKALTKEIHWESMLHNFPYYVYTDPRSLFISMLQSILNHNGGFRLCHKLIMQYFIEKANNVTQACLSNNFSNKLNETYGLTTISKPIDILPEESMTTPPLPTVFVTSTVRTPSTYATQNENTTIKHPSSTTATKFGKQRETKQIKEIKCTVDGVVDGRIKSILDILNYLEAEEKEVFPMYVNIECTDSNQRKLYLTSRKHKECNFVTPLSTATKPKFITDKEITTTVSHTESMSTVRPFTVGTPVFSGFSSTSVKQNTTTNTMNTVTMIMHEKTSTPKEPSPEAHDLGTTIKETRGTSVSDQQKSTSEAPTTTTHATILIDTALPIISSIPIFPNKTSHLKECVALLNATYTLKRLDFSQESTQTIESIILSPEAFKALKYFKLVETEEPRDILIRLLSFVKYFADLNSKDITIIDGVLSKLKDHSSNINEPPRIINICMDAFGVILTTPTSAAPTETPELSWTMGHTDAYIITTKEPLKTNISTSAYTAHETTQENIMQEENTATATNAEEISISVTPTISSFTEDLQPNTLPIVISDTNLFVNKSFSPIECIKLPNVTYLLTTLHLSSEFVLPVENIIHTPEVLLALKQFKHDENEPLKNILIRMLTFVKYYAELNTASIRIIDKVISSVKSIPTFNKEPVILADVCIDGAGVAQIVSLPTTSIKPPKLSFTTEFTDVNVSSGKEVMQTVTLKDVAQEEYVSTSLPDTVPGIMEYKSTANSDEPQLFLTTGYKAPYVSTEKVVEQVTEEATVQSEGLPTSEPQVFVTATSTESPEMSMMTGYRTMHVTEAVQTVTERVIPEMESIFPSESATTTGIMNEVSPFITKPGELFLATGYDTVHVASDEEAAQTASDEATTHTAEISAFVSDTTVHMAATSTAASEFYLTTEYEAAATTTETAVQTEQIPNTVTEAESIKHTVTQASPSVTQLVNMTSIADCIKIPDFASWLTEIPQVPRESISIIVRNLLKPEFLATLKQFRFMDKEIPGRQLTRFLNFIKYDADPSPKIVSAIDDILLHINIGTYPTNLPFNITEVCVTKEGKTETVPPVMSSLEPLKTSTSTSGFTVHETTPGDVVWEENTITAAKAEDISISVTPPTNYFTEDFQQNTLPIISDAKIFVNKTFTFTPTECIKLPNITYLLTTLHVSSEFALPVENIILMPEVLSALKHFKFEENEPLKNTLIRMLTFMKYYTELDTNAIKIIDKLISYVKPIPTFEKKPVTLVEICMDAAGVVQVVSPITTSLKPPLLSFTTESTNMNLSTNKEVMQTTTLKGIAQSEYTSTSLPDTVPETLEEMLPTISDELQQLSLTTDYNAPYVSSEKELEQVTEEATMESERLSTSEHVFFTAVSTEAPEMSMMTGYRTMHATEAVQTVTKRVIPEMESASTSAPEITTELINKTTDIIECIKVPNITSITAIAPASRETFTFFINKLLKSKFLESLKQFSFMETEDSREVLMKFLKYIKFYTEPSPKVLNAINDILVYVSSNISSLPLNIIEICIDKQPAVETTQTATSLLETTNTVDIGVTEHLYPFPSSTMESSLNFTSQDHMGTTNSLALHGYTGTTANIQSSPTTEGTGLTMLTESETIRVSQFSSDWDENGILGADAEVATQQQHKSFGTSMESSQTETLSDTTTDITLVEHKVTSQTERKVITISNSEPIYTRVETIPIKTSASTVTTEPERRTLRTVTSSESINFKDTTTSYFVTSTIKPSKQITTEPKEDVTAHLGTISTVILPTTASITETALDETRYKPLTTEKSMTEAYSTIIETDTMTEEATEQTYTTEIHMTQAAAETISDSEVLQVTEVTTKRKPPEEPQSTKKHDIEEHPIETTTVLKAVTNTVPKIPTSEMGFTHKIYEGDWTIEMTTAHSEQMSTTTQELNETTPSISTEITNTPIEKLPVKEETVESTTTMDHFTLSENTEVTYETEQSWTTVPSTIPDVTMQKTLLPSQSITTETYNIQTVTTPETTINYSKIICITENQAIQINIQQMNETKSRLECIKIPDISLLLKANEQLTQDLLNAFSKILCRANMLSLLKSFQVPESSTAANALRKFLIFLKYNVETDVPNAKVINEIMKNIHYDSLGATGAITNEICFHPSVLVTKSSSRYSQDQTLTTEISLEMKDTLHTSTTAETEQTTPSITSPFIPVDSSEVVRSIEAKYDYTSTSMLHSSEFQESTVLTTVLSADAREMKTIASTVSAENEEKTIMVTSPEKETEPSMPIYLETEQTFSPAISYETLKINMDTTTTTENPLVTPFASIVSTSKQSTLALPQEATSSPSAQSDDYKFHIPSLPNLTNIIHSEELKSYTAYPYGDSSEITDTLGAEATSIAYSFPALEPCIEGPSGITYKINIPSLFYALKAEAPQESLAQLAAFIATSQFSIQLKHFDIIHHKTQGSLLHALLSFILKKADTPSYAVQAIEDILPFVHSVALGRKTPNIIFNCPPPKLQETMYDDQASNTFPEQEVNIVNQQGLPCNYSRSNSKIIKGRTVYIFDIPTIVNILTVGDHEKKHILTALTSPDFQEYLQRSTFKFSKYNVKNLEHLLLLVQENLKLQQNETEIVQSMISKIRETQEAHIPPVLVMKCTTHTSLRESLAQITNQSCFLPLEYSYTGIAYDLEWDSLLEAMSPKTPSKLLKKLEAFLNLAHKKILLKGLNIFQYRTRGALLRDILVFLALKPTLKLEYKKLMSSLVPYVQLHGMGSFPPTIISDCPTSDVQHQTDSTDSTTEMLETTTMPEPCYYDPNSILINQFDVTSLFATLDSEAPLDSLNVIKNYLQDDDIQEKLHGFDVKKYETKNDLLQGLLAFIWSDQNSQEREKAAAKTLLPHIMFNTTGEPIILKTACYIPKKSYTRHDDDIPKSLTLVYPTERVCLHNVAHIPGIIVYRITISTLFKALHPKLQVKEYLPVAYFLSKPYAHKYVQGINIERYQTRGELLRAILTFLRFSQKYMENDVKEALVKMLPLIQLDGIGNLPVDRYTECGLVLEEEKSSSLQLQEVLQAIKQVSLNAESHDAYLTIFDFLTSPSFNFTNYVSWLDEKRSLTNGELLKIILLQIYDKNPNMGKAAMLLLPHVEEHNGIGGKRAKLTTYKYKEMATPYEINFLELLKVLKPEAPKTAVSYLFNLFGKQYIYKDLKDFDPDEYETQGELLVGILKFLELKYSTNNTISAHVRKLIPFVDMTNTGALPPIMKTIYITFNTSVSVFRLDLAMLYKIFPKGKLTVEQQQAMDEIFKFLSTKGYKLTELFQGLSSRFPPQVQIKLILEKLKLVSEEHVRLYTHDLLQVLEENMPQYSSQEELIPEMDWIEVLHAIPDSDVPLEVTEGKKELYRFFLSASFKTIIKDYHVNLSINRGKFLKDLLSYLRSKPEVSNIKVLKRAIAYVFMFIQETGAGAMSIQDDIILPEQQEEARSARNRIKELLYQVLGVIEQEGAFEILQTLQRLFDSTTKLNLVTTYLGYDVLEEFPPRERLITILRRIYHNFIMFLDQDTISAIDMVFISLGETKQQTSEILHFLPVDMETLLKTVLGPDTPPLVVAAAEFIKSNINLNTVPLGKAFQDTVPSILNIDVRKRLIVILRILWRVYSKYDGTKIHQSIKTVYEYLQPSKLGKELSTQEHHMAVIAALKGLIRLNSPKKVQNAKNIVIEQLVNQQNVYDKVLANLVTKNLSPKHLIAKALRRFRQHQLKMNPKLWSAVSVIFDYLHIPEHEPIEEETEGNINIVDEFKYLVDEAGLEIAPAKRIVMKYIIDNKPKLQKLFRAQHMLLQYPQAEKMAIILSRLLRIYGKTLEPEMLSATNIILNHLDVLVKEVDIHEININEIFTSAINETAPRNVIKAKRVIQEKVNNSTVLNQILQNIIIQKDFTPERQLVTVLRQFYNIFKPQLQKTTLQYLTTLFDYLQVSVDSSVEDQFVGNFTLKPIFKHIFPESEVPQYVTQAVNTILHFLSSEHVDIKQLLYGVHLWKLPIVSQVSIILYRLTKIPYINKEIRDSIDTLLEGLDIDLDELASEDIDESYTPRKLFNEAIGNRSTLPEVQEAKGIIMKFLSSGSSDVKNVYRGIDFNNIPQPKDRLVALLKNMYNKRNTLGEKMTEALDVISNFLKVDLGKQKIDPYTFDFDGILQQVVPVSAPLNVRQSRTLFLKAVKNRPGTFKKILDAVAVSDYETESEIVSKILNATQHYNRPLSKHLRAATNMILDYLQGVPIKEEINDYSSKEDASTEEDGVRFKMFEDEFKLNRKWKIKKKLRRFD